MTCENLISNVFWRVPHFELIDPGDVTVDITAPGIVGVVTAGVSPTEVEARWIDTAAGGPIVVPHGSYQITVTTAGSPVVFPMCYFNGDAHCDGVVTGADAAAIANPANWNHDLSTAMGPVYPPGYPVRVDLTRDGVVTGADAAVVANPANWSASSGVSVTCTCTPP